MLAFPLRFGDARLRAARGATRLAAFFLPAFFLLAFRLGRFVDFFAELLALAFGFALPRAEAFFGVVFFLAAMGRLVPLIRIHLPTQHAEKLLQSAWAKGGPYMTSGFADDFCWSTAACRTSLGQRLGSSWWENQPQPHSQIRVLA